MVGILHAHGTGASLSGQILDLTSFLAIDIRDDDRREPVTFINIEDLIDTAAEPAVEAEMVDFEEIDTDLEMTIRSSPLLGDNFYDHPGVALLADGTRLILDFDNVDIENDRARDLTPVCRFEYDDKYMPSFGGHNRTNVREFTRIEQNERFDRYMRRYGKRNNGGKRAKFQIDGKRACKSSRDHRLGNRQVFASMRDNVATMVEVWETFWAEQAQKENTFEPSFVGLTDEEASYYEAEAAQQKVAYVRELEMSAWYDSFDRDYSHLFESVTNGMLIVEVWERHLFPEQFEPAPEPFRLRLSDYYDDWDGGWHDDWRYDDHLEDHRHCHEDHEDDGPTLAEMIAIEMAAIERIFEEEADHFTTRFGGTVIKRKLRGYNLDAKPGFKRSKAHTADHGWRRFAPKKLHGRDSIRYHSPEGPRRYNAMDYLRDNAGMNIVH